MIHSASGWLDRVFPSDKRKQWKDWLVRFATEKPFIASFLLSQIALSGFPLVLFGVMSITVFIFALLAGILVGVIGALLFVVGALGFALLVLLPTLFFTTGAAVFIWLWGVGAYFIVKWFNQKEMPGVNTDMKGGLAKASGMNPGNVKSGGTGDASGNGKGPGAQNGSATNPAPKEKAAPPKLDKPKEKEGPERPTTTGVQHHADGKENQPQPGPQSKPQPQPQPPSQPQPGPQSKPQTQPAPQNQPQPAPQSKPQPQPQAQPQSQSQPGPQSNLQAQPQPQSQPRPRSQSQVQPQSQNNAPTQNSTQNHVIQRKQVNRSSTGPNPNISRPPSTGPTETPKISIDDANEVHGNDTQAEAE
jgi:xanthosine utilization system XapX-like protein